MLQPVRKWVDSPTCGTGSLSWTMRVFKACNASLEVIVYPHLGCGKALKRNPKRASQNCWNIEVEAGVKEEAILGVLIGDQQASQARGITIYRHKQLSLEFSQEKM
uniref:Uncharacterized protein n=1 Tax=Physcomitrium patens TaxID=3218 RepID=A0A2K1I9Y0_PHYPA|nr:hypothetical protein PHYPA_031159 [Physcomitrium patens]